MPRLDTASTMRMASVPRVTAAKARTSWSTPVEDSLCCIEHGLASRCWRRASSIRGAGTVSPKGAATATTLTP